MCSCRLARPTRRAAHALLVGLFARPGRLAKVHHRRRVVLPEADAEACQLGAALLVGTVDAAARERGELGDPVPREVTFRIVVVGFLEVVRALR